MKNTQTEELSNNAENFLSDKYSCYPAKPSLLQK